VVEELMVFDVPASRRQPAAHVTTATAAVMTNAGSIDKCRFEKRRSSIVYFLFIGGSSTNIPHIPLGRTLLAFLTILIFIVLSYARLAASSASETIADSKLRL
jgi:hypothetical protein